eukprot:jgi/Chlat1/6134/Chrsp41S05719
MASVVCALRVTATAARPSGSQPDAGSAGAAKPGLPSSSRPQPRAAKKAPSITETSEYMWNVDWQKQLDGLQREEERQKQLREKKEEAPSGFLSLGRSLSLDSLDVDLSQELLKPPPAKIAAMEREAEVARKLQLKRTRQRYFFVPTRGEQRRWERDAKYADTQLPFKPHKSTLASGDAEEVRLIRQREQARYAIGAAGSVAYLNMLARSVQSIGGGGFGGVQPRLLVPVALVMLFNRWNTLYAPETGIHLVLVPMLLGFFSYKAATLIQTLREFLPEDSLRQEESGRS